MRIGSLTSVNINQWTPTYQRTTIQKQVPGFIVAQTYDILARNNLLTINGYLVGTSASNLATQAMTLRGYATQKKVVWIDASDQYQGYCEMVRILEIDGPNLDIQNNGVLTADFTIKAQMLLPWGTTFSNPFRQMGIVLRDLNGVGMEYMLNPLEFNCNFSTSGGGSPFTEFSWEFILDNQNPFTNASSVQECACTSLGSGTASATNPIATNNPSSYQTAYDSIAIDSSNYAENLGGSLEGTKSSPVGSTSYLFGYNFGTSGVNISAYDRLRIWFRCDQAGQQYFLRVWDASGNTRWWAITLQAANTWQNLEVQIPTYTGQSGTPSFSAIQYIAIQVSIASSPPSSLHCWIQDLRAEIGYINHCEDTSGWTQEDGTAGTWAKDSTIFKQYNPNSTPNGQPASLKFSGTSSAAGNFGTQYAFPVSAWNFSSPTAYDFLLLWVRTDFGGNSTGLISIFLGNPTSYNTSFAWNNYSGLNANQWYRLVIPLRNPPTSSGSPNLNSIGGVYIRATGADNASSTLWISEIAVDVGNWVNLECMVPDNISQTANSTEAIIVQTWNGSAYSTAWASDIWGKTGSSTTFYYLDTTIEQDIWNEYGGAMYSPSGIGVAAPNDANITSSPPASTITMTSVWGTNNRIVASFKMPPATSDSVAGNYPSDDLSGSMAINKCRIKVQVYCSNEDTTYIGN